MASAALALALSLYPMEVVPFGANLAGAGLIGLGLGLMTRDGVLLLIGYAFAIGTVYLLVTADPRHCPDGVAGSRLRTSGRRRRSPAPRV